MNNEENLQQQSEEIITNLGNSSEISNEEINENLVSQENSDTVFSAPEETSAPELPVVEDPALDVLEPVVFEEQPIVNEVQDSPAELTETEPTIIEGTTEPTAAEQPISDSDTFAEPATVEEEEKEIIIDLEEKPESTIEVEAVSTDSNISKDINIQVIDEETKEEVKEEVKEETTVAVKLPDTVIPEGKKLEETIEEATEGKSEDATEKQVNPRRQHMENIFNELKEIRERGETVDVEVKSRIRGGLRVIYKDFPMFLPTSHYSLKRSPSEQEMQEAVGQKFPVHIHEYQEYDEGRKAVIVSRKKMLLDEFWKVISVGDIIEGRVSSVASFGVFMEFSGMEGLIHISRLSKVHIDNPNKYFKKGDKIQAVIIEIDKDKNRIALSRKELEESPWKNAETLFTTGSQHKGIVRRLTEFGAYIELKPGVDGLLRSTELSWTKRIKKPSDILKPGQEISVEILSVSEEKQTASLSYKRTQPNPWNELTERYPIGSEFLGTVTQVIPQGAVLSITEELDGFMPRSKMRGLLKGKRIPFQPGEQLEVLIADINPNEESLILAPKNESGFSSEEQLSQKTSSQNSKRDASKPKSDTQGTFSLGDLLSEKARENLINTVSN